MTELVRQCSPWLGQILLAVIVGFLSAWAGAKFALRRFRAERWWDRKADAYRTILEALHRKKIVLQDERSRVATRKPVIHDESDKEFIRKDLEAGDELRKWIDIGPFVLSPAATVLLTILVNDLNKAREDAGFYGEEFDLLAVLDGQIAAFDKCIRNMALIAKIDLGV